MIMGFHLLSRVKPFLGVAFSNKKALAG